MQGVQVSVSAYSNQPFNIPSRTRRDTDSSFDHNYQYSLNSSTTTLRHHIRNHHLESYLTLAREKGWNLSQVLLKGSQASESLALASAQGEEREEFDQVKFHERLVKFITADDQVCLFALQGRWSFSPFC